MIHDILYQCNNELEEIDKLLKDFVRMFNTDDVKKKEVECQLIMHFRTHQKLIDKLRTIGTEESSSMIQKFEEKKQQFQDLIYNENSSSISISFVSDDDNDESTSSKQYHKLGGEQEKISKGKKSKIEQDFLLSLVITIVYCFGLSFLWSFITKET